MSIYTVVIQGSDESGSTWQALHLAENTSYDDGYDSAAQVAAEVAAHQNIATHPARVCVWVGEDADTGTPPAAVRYL